MNLMNGPNLQDSGFVSKLDSLGEGLKIWVSSGWESESFHEVDGLLVSDLSLDFGDSGVSWEGSNALVASDSDNSLSGVQGHVSVLVEFSEQGNVLANVVGESVSVDKFVAGEFLFHCVSSFLFFRF